jgi:PAS domain S-box-containing protein
VRVTLFKYHLVSIEFGIAMATTTFLLVTLLMVYIVARQLNKLEEEKKETDRANINLSIDIAAEQKALKDITDANKRNQLFVQQSPSPIAMFDTQMRYLAASEQWIKDYKLEGKDIMCRSHYEVLPEIEEERKAVHRRCLQGAIDKCDEYYFARADGTGQWISWEIRPWYKSENEIGGLLMYTADISHYKKNEGLLQEATERLADAQQIAHVGSWEWDLKTNELKWSDEQYRIFGFEPHAITPTIAIANEMVHPDDREKLVLAANSGKDGRPYKSEFRIIRPDGSVRDVEASDRMFLDSGGMPERIIGTSADIIDRKKLEHALILSEKEFRSTFESSALGMSQVSMQGRLLRVNKELCKMLGYPEAVLVGKSFAELTYPDDMNVSLLALQQMKDGEIDKYQVEKRFVHKQGNIVWVEITVSIVFDESHHPLYLVSQIKDITGRKKLERDLMLSEKEFRSAFEDSAVGMTFVSLDYKWFKINEGFCRMLGYERQELMKMTFAGITHPDDLADSLVHLKKLVNKEIEKYQVEKRYIHKNGSIIWALLTVSAVFDDNGEPLYFIAQIADISLRKKLERELVISEKEFRSVFESSAIGMSQATTKGRFTKVNKEFCNMLGYTEAGMLETSFPDITYPEDREIGLLQLKKMMNGELESFQAEKRYVHKNGSIVWASIVVTMVFDDNRVPLYIVSQKKDITWNKQLERDLMLSEKEFRSAFENSAIGMALVSAEGRFIKVNPELCKMLGYPEKELVQITFPEITHPDDLADNVTNLKRLFSGEIQRYQGEKRYICKNGTMLWTSLTVSVVVDERKLPLYLVSQMKDITENKAAEEARRNYAVLESRNKEMEEFAYIASHDLQEPLRTVTGFVELLRMDFGEQLPEDAKEYVRFISASTKRMSELIKGLLDFSRIGKEKILEPVDCTETLNAVIADLGEAIKESNAIITFDDMPLIQAFPGEMQQLFQNLLSNAIKFRKPGITPRIHVSVKSLPGYWQFEVSDNGVGIQPRHYHKIFLLFQRLHNRGTYAGTGIGLSYCKKIVELHHGKIWVESVPDEGSSFFFTISKLNA